MKEKIITIKVNGVSSKQWSNLLLELNLVKKAWKPYGVDMNLSAPGLRSVLNCGVYQLQKMTERMKQLKNENSNAQR